MSISIAQVINNQLKQGGNVALICSMPHRFEFEHTRLMKIDVDKGNQVLPSNCRYVFFTTFISHDAFDWYLKQIKNRNLLYYRSTTGEIKSILKQVFTCETATVETKPTITKEKTEMGHYGAIRTGLSKAVRENYDPNKSIDENAQLIMSKHPDFKLLRVKNMISTHRAALGLTSGVHRKPKQVPAKIETKVSTIQTFASNLEQIIKDAHAAIDLLADYVRESESKINKFKQLTDLPR